MREKQRMNIEVQLAVFAIHQKCFSPINKLFFYDVQKTFRLAVYICTSLGGMTFPTLQP